MTKEKLVPLTPQEIQERLKAYSMACEAHGNNQVEVVLGKLRTSKKVGDVTIRKIHTGDSTLPYVYTLALALLRNIDKPDDRDEMVEAFRRNHAGLTSSTDRLVALIEKEILKIVSGAVNASQVR